MAISASGLVSPLLLLRLHASKSRGGGPLFHVPGFFLPGVDLITACDIRYCAQDAIFQVKVCHS
jgi:hypothetical protein